MAIVTPTSTIPFRMFANALARVGDVPAHRVLLHPAPGTATVLDVLDESITGGRGVELVDGILVEKPVGASEEGIAAWLMVQIFNFSTGAGNLGMVYDSQGPFRFRSGSVRLPDISFIRWDSTPRSEDVDTPPGPFMEVQPDLAVEVLSTGNTPREMAIKLSEYAAAGVKLVWYVDPAAKTVTVYPKARDRGRNVLNEADTLDGGRVLPGFALPVADNLRQPPAPDEEEAQAVSTERRDVLSTVKWLTREERRTP
jgi:Uma2 family endonuclease